MDSDSSSKFIGSLTKFLQSLCNGYVEFQRGVELVGHIYLSIDTGEKVDYILHEKVSKNDENSVTFVSNSFHAQPSDKDKHKSANDDSSSKPRDSKDDDDDDDDDIMIMDHTNDIPGSRNIGTIPSRGLKRAVSPGSNQRRIGGTLHFGQGGSNPLSLQRSKLQSATVTSQDTTQDNINMGEMKLEQISSDELLSLASQVGEGASSSNVSHSQGHQGGPIRSSRNLSDTAGQPVWIKQEAPDDSHGGPDTGWTQSHSDSSNSSSNFYPVMMHQNPAFTSSSAFPGFPSTSGSVSATSQQHGLPQSHPGAPGAANPYANPVPGTSQGGMDPADVTALALEGNEELQQVCEAVMRIRSRELTLRKAAELYGIPRSTLSDRVLGRVRLLAKRIRRLRQGRRGTLH